MDSKNAGVFPISSLDPYIPIEEYTYAEHVQRLNERWDAMKEELNDEARKNYKQRLHCKFPALTIKNIIKSDEDVKIVKSEVPTLVGKACEAFITELAYLGWFKAKEDRHRVLIYEDIERVISESPNFDFLTDMLRPKEKKVCLHVKQ
eukprot:TRINITY_DN5463_c0_g5_i1.p1 TRINITY_DN5463_c0_g5~~TRINITY_DN5463_c0_g5_i1.p1  ORF type:complete len:148 (+),score=33.86 TRINITY_DN5463_c0_g5_i1:152-595(+)